MLLLRTMTGLILFLAKLAMISRVWNWPCAMPTMRVPWPACVAEGGKGKSVGVLVDLEAGALERGLETLEFGRQDAILEVHGGGGVLHGAVVDDDELLNVLRDGGLGVAGKLRGVAKVGAIKVAKTTAAVMRFCLIDVMVTFAPLATDSVASVGLLFREYAQVSRLDGADLLASLLLSC